MGSCQSAEGASSGVQKPQSAAGSSSSAAASAAAAPTKTTTSATVSSSSSSLPPSANRSIAGSHPKNHTGNGVGVDVKHANKKDGITPSTSTEPVDVSNHSSDEDESVKSFGSHRSHRSHHSHVSSASGHAAHATSTKAGNSSAATAPGDGEASTGGYSMDFSSQGSVDGKDKRNPKALPHSSSIIGLDSMIENRREGGGLITNVVHMEVPFGKPIEEVYDGVHTGPVLGSGISGLVRLVTHKATGVKYAVKCLDLGLVDTAEGLAQLREEIFIMCQLDHPNIVRLEEVYESHSEIYLVQELCLGGELFDRLDEQPDYHYTEAECARLVKQMLCAVRYLHSKGIIHRDLKLENFLFSSTEENSELKMIDFGLSKHFRYGEVQHEAVGTPYTVAPEVIRGSYDERCDIWAIGVISFLLLSGEPPFGGCGGPEPLMTVRTNILRCDYAFEPADIWDLVSTGARDFIRALLVVDPKFRPTAREAQYHVWLREWANRTRTDKDNVLNPNVVKALVNFKEFSDMRKLLCEVLSFTLLPDQIKDLRREFEKMDTDGSGEISLAALKQVLVTNAGAGSLGALTEEEVEDIFNAMRVKKTETRIHWHEFIAAGLSQCQVDDRNLRLAFDRLDSDHKGYVTLDDIMDLLGSDALHNEEMMLKMWGDSMKAVNCSQARITYDDFLLLMKGQTREAVDDGGLARRDPKTKLSAGGLHAVPEETNGVEHAEVDKATMSKSKGEKPATGQEPTTPILSDAPVTINGDGGLTMPRPEKDDKPGVASNNSKDSFLPGTAQSWDSEHTNDPLMMSNPELESTEPLHHNIPKPGKYVRKRSRSMDDEASAQLLREMAKSLSAADKEELMAPSFTLDARRAVLLPEHDPSQKSSIINKNKTALQVNRQLYRAHRQMRLSVLEASKRFEEQQARHAHDILLAQQAAKEATNKGPAGLVMRRVQNKTVPSEAVKKMLEANRKEQQSLMEKANRRGGRGRRSRKKTISDMSGMMGSLSQDDLHKISVEAADGDGGPTRSSVDLSISALPEDRPSLGIPSVIDTSVPSKGGINGSNGDDVAGGDGSGSSNGNSSNNNINSPETNLRGATVPGDFRKVNDPFGAHGKYGRMPS